MICVENMSKSYGSLKAVDTISFELKPGEILGFIGPNGAGKSTTIKVLLNYIFADSGTARILGLDVERDSHLIKQQVGYVSSEVNFYPELTVEDIILMSMDFHGSNDRGYYRELLDKFVVDPSKKMKTLSLGNKKKVALIAALVIKPKVLIMDEPTNGLDPLNQKVLFGILRELALDGVSVLVSSHNMQEIQDHCDRVMFIKQGKLIETISLDDVSLNGKYIKIVGDIVGLEVLADEILKREVDSISMIYTGSLDHLLKDLGDRNIVDIVIEDVSMEHRFLKYYSDEVSV
jgi:ABC-2 type transport system ATP-binding protein